MRQSKAPWSTRGCQIHFIFRKMQQFLASLRRYGQSKWYQFQKSLDIPLAIESEKVIFDFSPTDDQRSTTWLKSSDKVIGGRSDCSWVKNEEVGKGYVFQGNISLQLDGARSNVVRSGFCAVRSKLPSDVHLIGFEALTMRVRTDGRRYRVNIEAESWNPNDLWMGNIQLPPNQWCDIELAFHHFLVTSYGLVKEDQTKKLVPETIQNIGITLADEKEGPFKFEIQWMKAIPKASHIDPSNISIDAETGDQIITTGPFTHHREILDKDDDYYERAEKNSADATIPRKDDKFAF